MAASAESCANCRFFLKHKKLPDGAAVLAGINPKEGRCRRFPQEQRKTEEDWCGEYDRRKE